jgi:prevent-host-death family protein
LKNVDLMGIFVPMKTISVPINEARTDLCKLVNEMEAGVIQVIILTSHGREKARIVPPASKQIPWRSDKPWNAKKFGDLQSPVMDDWK